MTNGERVKYYRERRNMTQERLAEATGIVPSSISKIEHDTRKVTLEEAIRIAKALEVSLAELAGESNEFVSDSRTPPNDLETLKQTIVEQIDDAFDQLHARRKRPQSRHSHGDFSADDETHSPGKHRLYESALA